MRKSKRHSVDPLVPFTSAKSTEFRRGRLFVGEICVRYILGPSFARFHRLLEYVCVMGVPCHGICVGLLVIGAKGVYRVVLLVLFASRRSNRAWWGRIVEVLLVLPRGGSIRGRVVIMLHFLLSFPHC